MKIPARVNVVVTNRSVTDEERNYLHEHVVVPNALTVSSQRLYRAGGGVGLVPSTPRKPYQTLTSLTGAGDPDWVVEIVEADRNRPEVSSFRHRNHFEITSTKHTTHVWMLVYPKDSSDLNLVMPPRGKVSAHTTAGKRFPLFVKEYASIIAPLAVTVVGLLVSCFVLAGALSFFGVAATFMLSLYAMTLGESEPVNENEGQPAPVTVPPPSVELGRVQADIFRTTAEKTALEMVPNPTEETRQRIADLNTELVYCKEMAKTLTVSGADGNGAPLCLSPSAGDLLDGTLQKAFVYRG